MKKTIMFARQVAALTVPALLAACGGSGGASGDSTPSALAVSGKAATGAAIPGGTVTAKCAAGTASPATTSSDGSYTVSVASGALPCVLQVTSADGAISLYSVATGTSTTSATANITPLTQLVVASLTGSDPATYFSSFNSTSAAAVTSSAVSAAQTSVVATLTAAGIDVSSVGDLLTGTLTAATASTAGNAYDVALDALATKLTSTGTTLATLTSAVASATTTTTPTTTASTADAASLPADLLLKPAASSCSALRSGTYRVVLPWAGSTLASQTGKIVVDAATLAITYTAGDAATWTADASAPCHFTDTANNGDIYVSQAGVIVSRFPEGNTYRIGIGFPEQTHTLAEFEGTFNLLGLGYDSTSAAYSGWAATGTFNAAGALTTVSLCEDATTWSVATCTTKTGNFPTFRVNASDGGFDVIGSGQTTVDGRTFLYRAGNGDLMSLHVDADGSLEVRTKKRTNELPAVGRVRTSWDLKLTNALLATPAVTASTNTIASVDATTGSFTRLAKTVGGTDEHLETVWVNSPRDGYNFRAAATVTGTDGTTVVNVTEWTNLALRGMGLNVLIRPAQKQFMFSVQQP